MYSSQDFQGFRPQKFKGGRIHLRPVDSIGKDFDLGALEVRGRKHFAFGETPVMQYKPCLKVGFPKNVTTPEIQFTYKSESGPKKLTYMPPIKKMKEFIPKQARVQSRKEVG